jgi:membrane fusion protein, multidrug efflux system
MFQKTNMCGKWRVMTPVLLFSLATLAAGCAKQQAAPQPRPPVPVVVGQVLQKTIPITLEAVGNVEAYSVVSIRSQVSGTLLAAHFKEGDFVRKGQLLLTIDPQPYQAALAQAQAALARDKAVALNNRVQAERYSKLLAEGVVPEQQVDSFKSAAEASDAVVNADEAAVKTTQLNLEYCTIYSPIDGRTGTLMVKPGNLVKAADVPIVVINQVNPIFVNFALPQQYWPEIKKYVAQGTLQVTTTVPRDPGPPELGALTFVDNAVDPTTGTIHLRATFTNLQNRLWPGLYVNASLKLFDQSNATVIPAQAVAAGQKGSYVYVLRADRTVEPRLVVSSRTVDGEAIIDQGLKPGETIVTDGLARLEPGAKVQIKSSMSEADPLSGSPVPDVPQTELSGQRSRRAKQ